MKIIFLDFDGVLASMDLLRVSSYLHILDTDKFGYGFDQRCIYNLQYIINETHAHLVISSSWRSMGLSKIKDMWTIREYPGKIIDKTPQIHDKTRGHEIEAWLEENEMSTNYIIIDDDDDMLDKQRSRFIRTNSEFGLTFENARNAVNILGSKG